MNQVVTLLLMGGLQTSKCAYGPMDKWQSWRPFKPQTAGSIPPGTTTVSMQPPFQEMYAIWPLPLIGLGGWPLKPAMLSSNLAGVTIKERCNILWDYLVYNNEFPYYSPKMIWLINNIGVR